MMEQEKKEFKKLREREKEKERDRDRDRERDRERDRAAMEKMAMERRRHEGDYRVIFQEGLGVSLFPLREGNRRFGNDQFLLVLQPHSEDVVRPRTRDEYEHPRNHNKPAR